MGDFNNIKRVCGFYVSSVHLITMMLPYLKEQIQNEIKIETFLEYNLHNNVKDIVKNITMNKQEGEKILKINWKSNKIKKYLDIDKKLKNTIENEKEINIIVSGSKKYIFETNKILNKFLEKNIKKIKNKTITIINCYEVEEFDDNIREILDEHDYMINTAGVHKIEDIFENYKKVN